METLRIKSSIENVAMSAQTVQKPTPSKPTKPQQTCLLEHSGHSDEKCYTRIQKEERELANKYREMMKKNSETAALTVTRATSSTSSLLINVPVTPLYYDEVYSVGPQNLTMVTLDTACTSHMFGSKTLLHNLKPIPQSPIQVASKSGEILAHERGLVYLDKI